MFLEESHSSKIVIQICIKITVHTSVPGIRNFQTERRKKSNGILKSFLGAKWKDFWSV